MLYTWERYLWRQLLTTFFGILLGFYALYVIIDYANQLGAFHQNDIQVTWKQWILYYAYECIYRADVLIPFALLLTTMRTLLYLNMNYELVALQSGGISSRQILRPLIMWGVACTLLLYANQEWLVPRSLAQIKILHATRKQKYLNPQDTIAQGLPLIDGSFLIYQNYDPNLERFFDIYWVKSIDHVLKMKYLYPYTSPPIGEFVETLQRDSEGNLLLALSEESVKLHDLVLNKEKLQEAATVPELQSLSELWKRLPKPGSEMTPREAQYATVFYHKALSPLLCLIVVLLPAPFCLRFRRQPIPFLFYCVGIFSFVTFYLLLDALTVLAKRQLADPAYLLTLSMIILAAITTIINIKKI